MSRYIDADRLIHRLEDTAITPVPQWIKAEIINAPTADVVEVVRCRDCKHADKYYHCTYMNKWNTADGFCYCGEREEQ